MRKEQKVNLLNKIQQKVTIISHDTNSIENMVNLYKSTHKAKKLHIETKEKINGDITQYITTITSINPRTLKSK